VLKDQKMTINHAKDSDQDGAYPDEVPYWQMMHFGLILERTMTLI